MMHMDIRIVHCCYWSDICIYIIAVNFLQYSLLCEMFYKVYKNFYTHICFVAAIIFHAVITCL